MVYADWLGDRDDPRGPFLRAEAEWAKPWRTGECPVSNPALQGSAARLDPVWVTRVSRPPLGVCCDHVGWYHQHDPKWYGTAGRPVTPADVERCQAELSVEFSPELRAWLLNCNGCSQAGMHFPPTSLRVAPVSSGEDDPDNFGWVEWFHTVWHHNQPAVQLVGCAVEARRLGLPTDWLCIAFVPEDDEVILSSAGRVCLWRSVSDGFNERNITHLAGSLGSFLSSLTFVPDLE